MRTLNIQKVRTRYNLEECWERIGTRHFLSRILETLKFNESPDALASLWRLQAFQLNMKSKNLSIMVCSKSNCPNNPWGKTDGKSKLTISSPCPDLTERYAYWCKFSKKKFVSLQLCRIRLDGLAEYENGVFSSDCWVLMIFMCSKQFWLPIYPLFSTTTELP